MITNPRCEYRRNPQAISTDKIRFSWEQDTAQAAYRILAATSPETLKENEPDLWDSGKVESSKTNQIRYEGARLKPFQTCFWQILSWHDINQKPQTSEISHFSTGPLSNEDWQGQWISFHNNQPKDAPFFRKEFHLDKPVKRAVVYYTAKGVVDAFINDQPVAEDLLTPGWTDYRKRIHYRAYDVTEKLVDGDNALGAIVSEGWYKGPLGFEGKTCFYGNRLMLLMNLRVEFVDGSIETIATNETWKSILGPILQSSFFYGENYDARMEAIGWNQPDFDSTNWLSVITHPIESETGKDDKKSAQKLVAHPGEPVRPIQEFGAITSWETAPGSYVFDIGRNIAGKVRLKVKGTPGQIIRLRHAEVLNKDKSIYVENLRSAYSTDTYIIKSRDEEIWEPRFTFHGFQYIEVTGLASPPLDTVTGIAISSAIEKTGDFNCSNKDINTLYNNTYWTQCANFIDVPTDCPQRDERLGWTGDAWAFANTACYNTDAAAFFTKWLRDIRDTQKENGSICNVAPAVVLDDLPADAAWADALFHCPLVIYEYYGDKEILRENYQAMKNLLGYYESTSKNYIRKDTHCFGDWLSDNADTPREVIQTAFFARAAQLVARTASILGETKDVEQFERLATKIAAVFNSEFVSEDGEIKGKTQTGCLLGLAFDLLPEEIRSKTLDLLVKDIESRGNRLSTGFIGTCLLMPTLSRFGRHDIAYKLLLQEEYPSWLFPIKNGATSIWERWNGWMPETGPGDSNMNSYAHYALGAVVEWIYRSLGGIDKLKPGFEEIKIQPIIGEGLEWANCGYHSIQGKIVSNWKVEGDTLAMYIETPANTKTRIHVPVSALDSITFNGEHVSKHPLIKIVESNKNEQVFEAPGGIYEIIATR